MRKLSVKNADVDGGMIVLKLTDGKTDDDCEMRLSTLDAASMISALNILIREVLDSPDAEVQSLPGMCRVQYAETPETLYFRVYLNDHIYHEYPLSRGTDLAEELMAFADRWQARQEAKPTYRSPDKPGTKH